MHTYWKDEKSGKWIVGFLNTIDEKFDTLAKFDKEIQAIGLVNYLNGGTQDITLIKELLEASSV